jgi:hypothetical protein
LVGSLKVDMRIACRGFDTVDGIDGITHCEPVPVFICVFSFKPANEISIVKIEPEKGNGETPGSILIKAADFIRRGARLTEGGETDGCGRTA